MGRKIWVLGMFRVPKAREEGVVRIIRPSLFVPSRGSRRVGRLSTAMEMTILCSQRWQSDPRRRWMTGPRRGQTLRWAARGRVRSLRTCKTWFCGCTLPPSLSLYFDYSTPLWRRRSCPPEKFTASLPFYGSRNMRGTLCYCEGASIYDILTEGREGW